MNLVATSFIRSVIARSNAGFAAADFAALRWGEAAPATRNLKSNPGHISTAGTLPGAVGFDFMEMIVEQSLFGRLFGDTLTPFEIRQLKFTSGISGAWVAQGKPLPMRYSALNSFILHALKLGLVVLMTKESAENSAPQIEMRVEKLIFDALDGAIAQSLLDPNNAGVANESPASLTYGLTPVSATADLRSDIAAMIAASAGDLSASVWVTDPVVAAQIALARDPSGAALYPDASSRGGSILGMPLLVSRSSPRDSNSGQITLIDPTGVAAAIGKIEIERSKDATVEASDAPAGGAGAVMISLWQSNLIALKGTVYCNWQNQRDGGVVVLTGAEYGP